VGFILPSERMASRVENILVSRFVIDGLSAVVEGVLEGSGWGMADPVPLVLRLSVLEMPFRPADGRDSGEPTVEEAWEVAGEARGFSGT
jgi:hypothetical protein